MSITYIWLLSGVVFVIAEALGVSGAGLLFAGLGAILVGMLMNLQIIGEEAVIVQFIIFFIATAGWAALLWKPMQKFRLGSKDAGGYSNIVGETAYVGSTGLIKGSEGEATWSGTIMKAEISPSADVDAIEPGAAVIILDVKGAKLIVKPKK